MEICVGPAEAAGGDLHNWLKFPTGELRHLLVKYLMLKEISRAPSLEWSVGSPVQATGLGVLGQRGIGRLGALGAQGHSPDAQLHHSYSSRTNLSFKLKSHWQLQFRNSGHSYVELFWNLEIIYVNAESHLQTAEVFSFTTCIFFLFSFTTSIFILF